MILVLNGSINDKMVVELAEAYNEVFKTEGEQLLIYLSSHGGSLPSANAMVDMINKYSDMTGLMGFGILGSAAFYIFFDAKCPKDLVSEAYGMFHLSSWAIDLLDGGKLGDEFDEFKMKHMKDRLKVTVEFAQETGLSEEEIEKIKNKVDVYFTYKRMKQLLSNQQKKANEVCRGKP